MNPDIPAAAPEIGRWLLQFACSHAKRESARLEAIVDLEETREGKAYRVRLAQGGRTTEGIVLGYPEVHEGRSRFAWCEDLGQRIRKEARALVGRPGEGESRSA